MTRGRIATMTGQDMIGYAFRGAMALALIAAPGFAHAGTTQQGTAKVAMVSAFTLVKTADLDFGTFSSGVTSGTVTINENTGARTASGGVTLVGGTPSEARFQTASLLGVLGTVTLSANTITLTNPGGQTMTASLAVQGGTGVRLLPGGGVQTFRVGGTLTVPANKQAGGYTGQFSLTVNYL